MPEQDDGGWLDQGSFTFEQGGRPVASKDREIHIGRLAGWRALPVEEIRVPVDEPETAAGGHCLEDAEQQGAVAPEDERMLAGVQYLPHTGGDRHRCPAHLDRADDPGVGVPSPITDAPVGLSGITRTEALDQSGRPQRSGAASSPRPDPEQSMGASRRARRTIPPPFFWDLFRGVSFAPRFKARRACATAPARVNRFGRKQLWCVEW